MPKHETAEKWVAWLSQPPRRAVKTICTLKVQVVETAKQFRIVADGLAYAEATAACGFRHLINKSDNTCLFDSELEALRQLNHCFTDQERRATAKANEAQENLFLINAALASKTG